ncbi:hypothetical protein M9Y10_022013 [Tritrichomonas musculus]|uniref:H15 domain-containing protein n=1 Tax=Tritrichomonas musculus TaxID=1915356 RepID=A0ABR2KR37_9EUKA
MNNNFNTSSVNEPKSPSRALPKLIPIICEAIAVNVTEDKKWTSIRKVRNYIEKYFDFSDKYIKRNLLQCIKEMENEKIIARKASAISFLYKGNANEQSDKKKSGRKKKDVPDSPQTPSRNLGPDVVITRSGRVSIVHKEDDDMF